jgi:hypothetical protein
MILMLIEAANSGRLKATGESCLWCGRINRVLFLGRCYSCAPAAWREGLGPVLHPWLAGPQTVYPWPHLVRRSGEAGSSECRLAIPAAWAPDHTADTPGAPGA